MAALSGGATASDEGSLSTALFSVTRHEALHSLRHPFVLQLGTGQLPSATFKGYIAQDAFFLRSFAKSYAHALTKCTDLEGIQAFHGLIGAVCDELKMHAKYCEELGITAEDMESPNPATELYCNFLLDVASSSESTIAEIMAAMAPCMRLYAFLGTSLAKSFETKGSAVSWAVDSRATTTTTPTARLRAHPPARPLTQPLARSPARPLTRSPARPLARSPARSTRTG